MTSHPTEPKLPESLEVVAWLYYEGEADALPKPGQDVWRSILLTLNRHDAYKNETALVRLTDAESALKARDAEIERLRGDADRYRLLRRGQKWSVIDGIGNTLRADELDSAIDRAQATGGEAE
ncbi:hypothetical protein D9M72_488570 [compost metagenome]